MKLNRRSGALLVAAGLAIALLITLFSPFASSSPDGLERVAEDEGFIETQKAPPYEIIADYAFPWVGNEEAATILAGMTGVLLVAGVASGLAFGLQRLSRRPRADASRESTAGDGRGLTAASCQSLSRSPTGTAPARASFTGSTPASSCSPRWPSSSLRRSCPAGQWAAFALLVALLATAIAAGRLPPLLVLRRSALALPFLLVALPLLFTKSGEALFTVPAVFWRWHATDAGLTALCSVLAKSLLSVAAAVVLTATTPPFDLLRALRGIGVPRIIVMTVSFMYRYLSVIGEEATRLLRARDCRSVRVDRRSGGSLLWRSQVAGNMVGSLFLRSYERSERVFDAMTARGYDGELRGARRPDAGRAFDWGLLLALAVASRSGLRSMLDSSVQADTQIAVAVRGLSFAYPDGQQALRDVSLRSPRARRWRSSGRTAPASRHCCST